MFVNISIIAIILSIIPYSNSIESKNFLEIMELIEEYKIDNPIDVNCYWVHLKGFNVYDVSPLERSSDSTK